MIPLPDQLHRCQHDGDPAVAIFYAPAGCVAFPNHRFMPLCAQHVVGDGAIDGWEMIWDWSIDGAVQRWYGVEGVPFNTEVMTWEAV